MTGIDALIEQILRTNDTITVVGASASPGKAAHDVPAAMRRHGWRIVPVNPRGGEILGERAYQTLAEAPRPVGLVDVFRPAEEAPDIAMAAVAAGAAALWLQLGIVSPRARAIADRAGLPYVEDRCVFVERQRLGITGAHA